MYVVTITPQKESPMCVVDVVKIKGGLSDWQRLVGGLIEVVPTFQDNLEILINEEGKLDNLPLNIVATALTPIREYDFLVGTAVLVKLNAARDNWTGWRDDLAAYQAFENLVEISHTEN